MGTVGWAAGVWLVLGGIYLLLAGDLGTVEIVAGLVCASAGTALAVGLRHVARRRFSLRPPPRVLISYLTALVTDTFAVGRQLVLAIPAARDRRGGFVRQPFEPGADDDPATAGRHAVAILGVSLAPGSFVVRGERSDTLILHALPEKPASPDHWWAA